LGIASEILRIADKGVRKSHIAFEAKLNYKLLTQYLDNLEKQGLVTCNEEPGNMVKATEKGRLFVRQYRDLLTLVGQDEPLE